MGAFALFMSTAAFAGPSFVGTYRLAGGPDMVGELILRADSHFRYELGGGALNEQAQGRWEAVNGRVLLYTEPRPKRAIFSTGQQAATQESPLKLLVTWPDGRGVAGVDFTIGFDAGPPETGYTQDYGWTMSPDEHRVARWIELVEPIYGVVSQRFGLNLNAGNALTFILIPNDLGIADFEATVVERVGDRLIMHQRLGDLTFVSDQPDADGASEGRATTAPKR